MTEHGNLTAPEIRSQLGHPVVDGDGHWRESLPVFLEYLSDEAGPAMVDRYRRSGRGNLWYELTPAGRAAQRVPRSTWWGLPSNAEDLATAMVPGAMYERLEELGFDFGIIYTSLGLQMPLIREDDLRIAATRALNAMTNEAFAPYSDRLTPAAVIPTFTPGEAVAGVRHAVVELGFKVIMLSGTVPRPTANGFYVDTIALDSPYNYEPLWKVCTELQVAVTDHGGSWYWPDRMSPTNMVFNHVGHFANALHASCRGIVLGGVPLRHRTLPFAFLEGGVGWANTFLGDLLGHYEKRNATAIEKKRPTNVDRTDLQRLFLEHAVGRLAELQEEVFRGLDPQRMADRETDCFDDFELAGISSARDIQTIFEQSFYFGCEADDPMTVLGFDPRMPGRLRPFFSSDISHFDVPVMADVLPEAWEMVEDGRISEEDFEEFTFTNIVKLHTSANPKFFDGTAVETAVREIVLPTGAAPESAGNSSIGVADERGR